VSTVGLKKNPVPFGASPPVKIFAPTLVDSLICFAITSREFPRTSGPIVVFGSRGSPTICFSTCSWNFFVNSSKTSSCTMNLLAAMQL